MAGPTSSTENVKLGVCTVLFNAEDLGFTKGGVEVEVTTDTHEVTVDQFGDTPIDELVTGRKVTVKVPLAETTLDNLVRIMPGATLIVDGTDPKKRQVVVDTGVSISLLSIAKKLVLRPKGTTGEEDFTIFKAMTAGAISFAYQSDTERVFNVSFKGYADATGKLFALGDTTAAA
ncbi:hypothetical protein [Phyllobacterium myrsinacearum]|uniref:Phage tail protein n=1 Tax=Phyllobacterium myrsinacearum TaxID=28101 RepID=A0A839EU70_9HYPH|nr:hypothetical protein [Phyllobacterium myrsinacearum]MBA8881728.1 hypothetical protein [Phyllobacterium myrsinacearum]